MRLRLVEAATGGIGLPMTTLGINLGSLELLRAIPGAVHPTGSLELLVVVERVSSGGKTRKTIGTIPIGIRTTLTDGVMCHVPDGPKNSATQ